MKNLVAEYRFDTGAGDTAYDTKGNNDGTINDALWTSGIQEESLEFDGSSSISISHDDSFQPVDGFTASVWMRPNNVPPSDAIGIVGNSDYQNGGFTLGLRGGDYVASLNDDSSEYLTYGPQAKEKWVNLVVSYDGSTSKLYLNGERVASQSSAMTSNSNSFQIGSTTQGGWNNFNGKVDGVKIYSETMNESQIKSIYNSGSWKVRSENENKDPSKVLDMNFQHVQNGEVLDSSGNSNHGSIENGATQVGSAGCKVGRCFSFDGSDGELIIPDDESLNFGTENFAVSFWFEADTLESGAHRFQMKRDGYQDNELSLYHSGGSLVFRTLNSNNGGPDVVASTEGLERNKFYHVVGTRDGDTLELYLNGERVSTASGLANVSSSGPTYIGSKKPHNILME